MRRGRVVPVGWAAHHRPVVEGFFADAVTVERLTGATTDRYGNTVEVWTPLLTDTPALLQIVVGNANPDRISAGDPLIEAPYLLRIPVAADPGLRDGDRVTCTASEDPRQIGVQVTVRLQETQGHVVDGSYHCERATHGRTPQPGG